MVEALLAIFTGGNGLIVGLIGIVGAIFAAWIKGRASGAQSERIKQRAKDADSYEKHLQDLDRATAARNNVRPDDGMSNDKYRRD